MNEELNDLAKFILNNTCNEHCSNCFLSCTAELQDYDCMINYDKQSNVNTRLCDILTAISKQLRDEYKRNKSNRREFYSS